METDILADIIATEREIQQRLAAEEGRLRERLEEVRREMAGEEAAEEERLRRRLGEEVAAARREAERRAALLLEETEARGERLARLDDDTLRRIVLGRLAGVLAGAGHDRQDDEG
uniref:Uncharacterized protein n=1 Tax=Geobacter metallireducens TaxID=28232 RepID=A0A831U116_GEOME